MISSARTLFLVAATTLLVLQCVSCAPNSEASVKSNRVARYIQTVREGVPNVVKPADSPSKVRQNGDYSNNSGSYNNADNYNNGGNYNTGANYNNGQNYSNGGNYNSGANYNNGGNNGGNYNKPEQIPDTALDVTNDGNPEGTAVVEPPKNPPQHVGFSAVVNAFWNMVLSFIRGTMGIERRNPPRIARALIRAAVSGKEECWKTSACHAGRMMRGIPNSDIVFMVAERFTTGEYKKLVRRVRRAAEDNEDCKIYECSD